MSMRADIVYGKKFRFTANPVQLPTTTGTLRMAAPKVNVSSTTCAGPKHVSARADPFSQHYVAKAFAEVGGIQARPQSKLIPNRK
eukprot:scaffold8646_cov14-Prasinocladus_malaysianus.AAC.1